MLPTWSCESTLYHNQKWQLQSETELTKQTGQLKLTLCSAWYPKAARITWFSCKMPLCPCQCSMRASLLSCGTSSDCLLFISHTLRDSAQSNKSFYTSERVKVGSWAKTCVIWKVDVLLVWTLAILSALCKFPSLFYLYISIGSHGTAARLSWAENPRYAQPRTPAVGTVMKH